MQETHQFVYLFPSNSLNAFCHTIRIEHPDTSSVANSADGGTKALLPCSLLLPQLSYKSAGDEVLPLGMCITEALPSPFLKQSQRWHSPLSLWTRQAIFFPFKVTLIQIKIHQAPDQASKGQRQSWLPPPARSLGAEQQANYPTRRAARQRRVWGLIPKTCSYY